VRGTVAFHRQWEVEWRILGAGSAFEQDEVSRLGNFSSSWLSSLSPDGEILILEAEFTDVKKWSIMLSRL
jgi:hypothetical protein